MEEAEHDAEQGEHDHADDLWNPQDGYGGRAPAKVTPDGPLEMPFRALSSGLSSGLTFTLDLQSKSYDCPVSASHGLKLALHTSVSVAPSMLNHGFVLAPGKEYFVGTKPDVVYASESIWSIPATTR